MSGLFVSQSPFLFQVWPDLERNQDTADRPGELLRTFTRSCFLLLLLGRLFLLASSLLGIYLPSLWSPPFPSHALTLIFLSREGAALAHLDSSLPMIWYSGQTTLFLFLLTKAAVVYLPTALFVVLRPLFHMNKVVMRNNRYRVRPEMMEKFNLKPVIPNFFLAPLEDLRIPPIPKSS